MRPKHKELRRPRRVLRLRQLRRARELTQTDVAKRVGIHLNAYNRIEKGKATPSYDTATNIAQIFGEPVERVFEYVEVPA